MGGDAPQSLGLKKAGVRCRPSRSDPAQELKTAGCNVLKAESEQGTGPGHEYPLPADAELLAAYEQLVVGRRVNDQNSALVRQGRMAVYPSSHGQEACPVAAALCLADGDWLFPTRDAVAVMARGVDPVETMTIFRVDWHNGYDPARHKVGIQCTPLTTQLLHGVGVAHAPSSAERTPGSWPCAGTAPPARRLPRSPELNLRSYVRGY